MGGQQSTPKEQQYCCTCSRQYIKPGGNATKCTKCDAAVLLPRVGLAPSPVKQDDKDAGKPVVTSNERGAIYQGHGQIVGGPNNGCLVGGVQKHVPGEDNAALNFPASRRWGRWGYGGFKEGQGAVDHRSGEGAPHHTEAYPLVPHDTEARQPANFPVNGLTLMPKTKPGPLTSTRVRKATWLNCCHRRHEPDDQPECAEQGVLTFVGAGQGRQHPQSAITWKYTGYGEGGYSALKMKSQSCTYLAPVIAILFILVLLVIVAGWLVLNLPNTKTTTSPSLPTAAAPSPSPTDLQSPPTGRTLVGGTSTSIGPTEVPILATSIAAEGSSSSSCLVYAEPHIQTFDGSRINVYGSGDVWLVRTKSVHIQARLVSSVVGNGRTVVSQVAVGGVFLQGHLITVTAVAHGTIQVDGKTVLRSLGDSYLVPGVARLRYSSTGALVDEAKIGQPLRVVNMKLPHGITLTVFRWDREIDVRVTMSKQGSHAGFCGNFNADPADDTTRDIMAREVSRVSPEARFFKEEANVKVSPAMESLISTKCDTGTSARGRALCKLKLAQEQTQAEIEACVLDWCFGGDDSAMDAFV